ncbi:MAG: Vmh family MBL fold metallo-hydrolase [Marinobacter sp.]|nr:Vmh family MBL fold metallo-hydrolase [Marinobacter sp.]
MNKTRTFLTATALLASVNTLAADLELTVYNPGEEGIFPVTSTLITGPSEAMLVDAQFSTIDGDALVELIRDSGKTLTTIYISGGDPDFYFGLEPLVAAFPDAEVLASPAVVAHINETRDRKIDYWGPKLGDGAPDQVIVPEASERTEFQVDGEPVEVHHINTHQAYLWLPGEETILGGVAVYGGTHVWTADSQSREARQQWQAVLEEMINRQPQRVIPGHYLGQPPQGADAVVFTRNYLQDFEQALTDSHGSAAVIEYLKAQYPTLPGEDSLTISAKVNTGEMDW